MMTQLVINLERHLNGKQVPRAWSHDAILKNMFICIKISGEDYMPVISGES